MTLLLVILIMAALLSISFGIFNLVFTEIKLSGELTDSFNALYASDRGVEKLLYLDLVADAVCESFIEATGSFPPCPPYKAGMPMIPFATPILFPNGACMNPHFTRTGNKVVTSTVGQYSCANLELSVKRVLLSTYTKSSPSGIPTPLAYWNFNWGTGEGASTQNVEDVVEDDRALVEADDGVRGMLDIAEGLNDPTWINPFGGSCVANGNCALRFDGVRNIVNVGSHPNLDTLNQSSVSFWVYPKSLVASARIVDKGLACAVCPSSGFRVIIDPTTATALRFIVGYTGAANLRWVSLANVLEINTWQHFLFTWDGGSDPASSVKAYKNGLLLDPDPARLQTGVGSQSDDALYDFYIGAIFNLNLLMPVNPFSGCIDNVRVWGVPLTAPNAAIDYNSYTPGTQCP